MSGYSQYDSSVDNASLDALLSMPAQTFLNVGSQLDNFTGLATLPEDPGDFIQKLANQVWWKGS
jgi:hypothetical protein